MEQSTKRRRVCENDGRARGASSTHASTEGQEVATSSGYDYEVFLSFRGPDTRAGFTDFLYTSMIDMGIRAYKDDEDLRKGEEFGPKLLKAIEQSRISIPIFSKGYASSVWCLKELVKMVECQKTKGQKIMPIFYDVAPTEVRYQTGGYKEAFDSHKNDKRHDEETMLEWKAALKEVSFLNGGELSNMKNRREGGFARKLTQEVFNELKKAYLVVSDYLVSIDNHVDAIMEMIGAGTSETQIIGMHGMGGIGKSTIAKLIYNKLLHDFENCCFLRDIRETSTKNGIQCLQNQLISDILKTKSIYIKDIDEGTQTIEDRLSNKRILLLLDDVEKENQIDALVGKRDWLAKGSKIIITTRNKDILYPPKVDYRYEVSSMDPDRSLQLFSKHAFRRDSPLDEYMPQSRRAIGIAGGLPLTLEVLGSLLGRTEKKKWDLMLRKSENVPHETIQSKLKISYDALDVRQQYIFLDIACFFIGYDKDIVVHFWDESKFPEEAMEVLQNMSLIKIEENNIVWMHDQLRDLGREIVRQESKMKIEKQSRVWDPKEALDLLRRPKGRKEVEALCLKFDHEGQYHFTYEGFKSLSNIRFLQVDSSAKYFDAEERLFWDELPLNVLPTIVFQENSDLLPQLRWLAWHDIPPTFKITNFFMKDVVILDLSKSRITHDWEGWSHMKVMKNLKVLDLHFCLSLERTPNFSAHSKLERLILSGCDKLVEIDVSICQLKSLVFLDVGLCENLRRLPDELGKDLASLKYLSLKYCHSLERLPNTIGNLEFLNELNLCGTRIEELPDSIGNLKSLIELDISNTGIKELPDSIGNLKSLIELDISNTGIKELPDSIGNLELLNKLNMDGIGIKKLDSIGNLKLPIESEGIKELPDSIGNLKSLIDLDISNTGIKELPDSIGQLENLKVVKMNWVATSKIPNALWMIEKLEVIEAQAMYHYHFNVEIGNHIYRNRSLRILRLENGRIYVVPRLPESLINLQLSKLYINTFLDLSNLTNLKKLELEFVRRDSDGSEGGSNGLVEEDPMPLQTGSLHGESNELVEEDPIGSLHGESGGPVEEDPMPLRIGHLSKLESLRLTSLYVTTFPTDIRSLLPQLKSLSLYCPNLRCFPSFPSSLSDLHLNSGWVSTLPTDMSSLLPRLKSLFLVCPNLRCLPSLPSSLLDLHLSNCKSCCTMEDLSNLKTLSSLHSNDWAISEIRGLNRLKNLQILWLHELQQLEILPDLSNLNKLGILGVSNCGNLVEIQGELPSSLQQLGVLRCRSLHKLADLSSLKGLERVEIKRCGKLNVEAISSLCLEKAIGFSGDEPEGEDGSKYGFNYQYTYI